MTENVKAISYGCPIKSCRSTAARTRGWLDPADARRHIAARHRSRPEPAVIRWPHPIETYEANGAAGIGPRRSDAR